VSLDNPWTMHRQSFWAMQAGNSRLTLWHRVYALAYGVHRRNGHAPFREGELILALTIVDKTTGQVHEPRVDEVSRAIRTAVDYGFLADESCMRCLVIPEYAISGGMLGSPKERCHSHRGRWSP
jgi:hypothetical protein